MIRTLLICLFLTLSVTFTNGQPFILDRVAAIVGDFMVLQSDIESQYLQYRAQGQNIPDLKCMIFKELLEEKLLLNQAKIDSIEVSEGSVQVELERRIQHFINMMGSREELEQYFNKSILEIKNDFREPIKNQLITNKMQSEITGDITVTPSEIRAFYNKIPKDSIPNIDSQIEYEQIVIYPVLSEQAVFDVKERMLNLRRRITEGESFETLAILYSEDGSSSLGGEIGFFTKSELDPEYAKIAFSLKEGQVSKIVESAFGFHIIQLIARRDDRVNTRHILMKPAVTSEARNRAIGRLDSIVDFINKDSISFLNAARMYSEDKDTRLSGGLVINPQNNSSWFEYNQLQTNDYLILRDMEAGDISAPFESTDQNGKIMYKIVRLKSRTEPHRANLQQDYHLFKQYALQEKNMKVISKWIQEKQLETYIHIDEALKSCEFLRTGWLVQ